MIDISVFFVNDEDCIDNKEKSILNQNTLFRSCRDVVGEHTANNLEVRNISIDDIPESVESDLVIFLNENLYVKDNFIDVAVGYAHILEDIGVLCGATKTYQATSNKMSEFLSVYEYDLRFFGSKVSDITGETNNYPPIPGCIISGKAYNEISYTPTRSNRHHSLNNHSFLNMLSRRFKIYYTDHLDKIFAPNNKQLSCENLLKKYYDDGYQIGSTLFHQHSEKKILELWHRFVQSPESFDYNCPRWLMQDPSNKTSEYLENLIIFRCQYQIGFYEGMTNKILI